MINVWLINFKKGAFENIIKMINNFFYHKNINKFYIKSLRWQIRKERLLSVQVQWGRGGKQQKEITLSPLSAIIKLSYWLKNIEFMW